MICRPCRESAAAGRPHGNCANFAIRAARDGLPIFPASRCDCQHAPAATPQPVSHDPGLAAAVARIADMRSIEKALR